MTISGNTLHLNADSAHGTITVEVLVKTGESTAKSLPITANGLDIAVEWDEGGLDESEGPVALRFRLENALLYAFWCE